MRTTIRTRALGAVFLVLSWGPRFNWMDVEWPIPLPYAALARLPLFDAALPLRLALIVAVVFGILLALFAQELMDKRLTAATTIRAISGTPK